jgi:hypothetical protein
VARGFVADVIEQFGAGGLSRVESAGERVTGAVDSAVRRMQARVARWLLVLSYGLRLLAVIRASAVDRPAMVLLVMAIVPLHLLRMLAKQEWTSPRRFSRVWRLLPVVATVGVIAGAFALSHDWVLLLYLVLAEPLNYAGRRILADVEP